VLYFAPCLLFEVLQIDDQEVLKFSFNNCDKS